MIMMCQFRFIDCNTHTALAGGVDGGEAVWGWGGGVCENPELNAQFCYEHKATLKNKIYLFYINNILKKYPLSI